MEGSKTQGETLSHLDKNSIRLIVQHWVRGTEIRFIASHVLGVAYGRYKSSCGSYRSTKKITWSESPELVKDETSMTGGNGRF